jgi:hypothetical protein
MGQGGQLLHHVEVSFQGGQPPKQVMEVEVEGNVCEGWLLFNEELLTFLHSRGKEG